MNCEDTTAGNLWERPQLFEFAWNVRWLMMVASQNPGRRPDLCPHVEVYACPPISDCGRANLLPPPNLNNV